MDVLPGVHVAVHPDVVPRRVGLVADQADVLVRELGELDRHELLFPLFVCGALWRRRCRRRCRRVLLVGRVHHRRQDRLDRGRHRREVRVGQGDPRGRRRDHHGCHHRRRRRLLRAQIRRDHDVRGQGRLLLGRDSFPLFCLDRRYSKDFINLGDKLQQCSSVPLHILPLTPKSVCEQFPNVTLFYV